MSEAKRFNIRVYGIWIKDEKVLVNDELIRGTQVIKFPGGGLDWGEGTVDCLKREWKEELDMDIEIADHFYTTDYFQHSAYDGSQVISIYYLVTAQTVPDVIVNHMPNERTYWMDMQEVTANTFTLAIDRKVGGMLQELYNSKAASN
jgi:ADP-ribose pyrophosphatase YjhB (NUDIX family)